MADKETIISLRNVSVSYDGNHALEGVNLDIYADDFLGIIGPNGGGKSNVLEAINTLVAKILRPIYATADTEGHAFLQKRIIVEPFAFLEEYREPNL